MTCEVAVMNKRGIALAADSAVTLGEGPKIYYTAEKLFALSERLPVAVMTYGNADLMDAPWEMLIKLFAQQLDARGLDRLEDYSRAFIAFIEASNLIFPAEVQRVWVGRLAGEVWSGLYRRHLSQWCKDQRTWSDPKAALTKLSRLIDEDHKKWAVYGELDGFGAAYGEKVTEEYRDLLDEVEAAVFKGLKLTSAHQKGLRQTITFMFGNKWFDPDYLSGIVFAGMGESEAFPKLLQYTVGTMAADRLRFAKTDEAAVGYGGDSEAIVAPMAQTEAINMIINGIHPNLSSKIVETVGGWLSKAERRQGGGPHHPRGAVDKFIESACAENYTQSFMRAVAALPRQDLARMAESLVSLAVFLKHMSSDQEETVGGPVDVAILSKGDGFTWIKRKRLDALV